MSWRAGAPFVMVLGFACFSLPSLDAGGACGETAPDSVGAITPADQLTIPVSGYPEQIEFGVGALWVRDVADSVLTRVDPVTASTTATGAIPDQRQGGDMAIASGEVWVGSWSEAVIARIDPITSQVVATIDVPGYSGLAGSESRLWVATSSGQGHKVIRQVEVTANKLGPPIRLRVPGRLTSLVAGEDDLWVGTARRDGSNLLVRVDANGVRERMMIRGFPSTVGDGALWVTDEDTLTRVDGGSGKAVRSPAPVCGVEDLALGGGYVWMPNYDFEGRASALGLDHVLAQIDPRTLEAIAVFEIPDGPHGAAYAAEAVWITNTDHGTVTRIQLPAA